MHRQSLTSVGLILLVVASIAAPSATAAAAAPPQPPTSFYGNVTVNDDPAESGTTITAWIDGQQVGSITSNQRGQYGGSGPGDPKLDVSCSDCTGGETISFKVNGVNAKQTGTFESGEVKRLDLTFTGVTTPTPTPTPTPTEGPPGGGGGDGGAPPTEAPPTAVPPGDLPAPDDLVERETTKAIQDEAPDTPGTTVRFEEPESTVREVTFANEGADGSVTVRELSEVPEDVQDADGNTVVHAVHISVSEDLEDSAATVTMSVPLDQLGNVDPADARIAHRRDDGTWEPLETVVVSTGGGEATLKAETGGFLLFAVVVPEQQTTPTTEEPEETTTPTTPSTTDQPETTTPTTPSTTDQPETTTPTTTPMDGGGGSAGFDWTVIGLIVLVLVLIGAAVVYLRSQRS